jgi:acyl-CoA synthetase
VYELIPVHSNDIIKSTLRSTSFVPVILFWPSHSAQTKSAVTLMQYRTGGPIFAGPCMSHVLPSQVLVCCRNGCVYSLEPESGCLVWEDNIGDPITASAYIDENLHFESHELLASDRY